MRIDYYRLSRNKVKQLQIFEQYLWEDLRLGVGY